MLGQRQVTNLLPPLTRYQFSRGALYRKHFALYPAEIQLRGDSTSQGEFVP
jgi:hypothetical protein